MNFVLLAFVLQIFGLYAMILLSDYVQDMVTAHLLSKRLRESRICLRP